MAQPASRPAEAEGPCSTPPERAVAPAGAAPLILGRFPAPGAVVPLVRLPVPGGAGTVPLAAPGLHPDFPSWARTVLGSGTSAGALVTVLLNPFFHHLGTHGRTAVALKSS